MASTTLTNNSSARRDSTFLVLAPNSSEGYPTESSSRSSSMSSTDSAVEKPILDKTIAPDASAVDITTVADPTEGVTKARRSSSISSTGSARLRFLKLGPVHFGGNPLESDFAEVQDQ